MKILSNLFNFVILLASPFACANTSSQVLTKLPESDSDRIFSIMRHEDNTYRALSAQSFAVVLAENNYALGASVSEEKIPNSTHWRFFAPSNFLTTRGIRHRASEHISSITQGQMSAKVS